MHQQQKILNSPFNIETHKTNFVNYLEVIIDEFGMVMYAVPSHQEKLISIACMKLDVSRDELYKLCPEEFYFDLMIWLCSITGCVALWNEFMQGKANENQQETIQQLIREGLYRGMISA